jgi:glycosyltransferase involved in cell wall biosynthesis
MTVKKVIIIGSFLDSLLWFRTDLIKTFLADGYEVIACAPQPENKNLIQKLSQTGAKYIELPMTRTGLNPLKDISVLWFLYKLFRKESPRIVLSYAIKPVIYGSIAAKSAGVPAIYSMVTGLGHAFMSKGIKGWVLRTIASTLYKIAFWGNTKIFFQNPDDRELYLEKKIINNIEHTQLINGSGVDVSFFSQKPFPANISFLLVARLLRDKGIYEYVEAARKVKQKYPKIIFKLVGFLDINPTVISPVDLQQWQDDGIIEFLGRSDNVNEVLEGCSVFVLPSYREGTPRTVLEAMAVGRPIITTDVPGCRETTINGENGYLVNVRDAVDLQQAMERFIENPKLLEEMGTKSRQIAEEKYDVHKVNKVILETINNSL